MRNPSKASRPAAGLSQALCTHLPVLLRRAQRERAIALGARAGDQALHARAVVARKLGPLRRAPDLVVDVLAHVLVLHGLVLPKVALEHVEEARVGLGRSARVAHDQHAVAVQRVGRRARLGKEGLRGSLGRTE
jgi:hypothetical protein